MDQECTSFILRVVNLVSLIRSRCVVGRDLRSSKSKLSIDAALFAVMEREHACREELQPTLGTARHARCVGQFCQ